MKQDRRPLPVRFDPNIGILLREPFLAFSEHLLERLNRAGYEDLRPAHLVVFQHIDPAGSRVTDLAAKAQMTKPSMAYLVEELERRGYVERHGDPNDGRAKLIRLTERGWSQIRDALDIIAAMENRLASQLGDRRWRSLRTLLHDLASATAELSEACAASDNTRLSHRSE